MADDAKSRLEKVRKLVAALEELEGKRTAILNELRAVAGGAAMVGDRLKSARLWFSTAWSTRYSGPYHWNFGKDDALAKKLFERFDDADLANRAIAFVKDADPFLTRNAHTFSLFYSTINKYAGSHAEQTFEAPADCAHVPACRSDSEHTQRKMREVRGDAF